MATLRTLFRQTPAAAAILPIAFLAVSCQTTDLTNSAGSKITARVTATDVSQPTLAGRPVSVSGTVTFNGLTVELWDGQRWLTVANGSGSAALNLGDGSVGATLVPATEIPAGDYSMVRVSATSAVIDVTVNGLATSAQLQTPSGQSLVIEKTVTVTVNPDGSRTLSVQLEMLRTITLVPDPATGATMLSATGDLGSLTAPAVAPARVVASDVSQPTTSPAGMTVSGTATFTGLTVELWNGQDWLAVTKGQGSAIVNIGDGAAAATLVPTSEIPAGLYSKARLTAADAVIDLSLTPDGRQVTAQVGMSTGQPLVIERDVTVTANPDGSRTLAIQLQMVRSVALQVDPISRSASVSMTGDLGAVSAAATAH